MDFFATIDMIVDDLRHCSWAVKEVHPAVNTTWGIALRADDRTACYLMAPPFVNYCNADNILFHQSKFTSQWCAVYAAKFYVPSAGNSGPIFSFDNTASSQHVQDKLLDYFTNFVAALKQTKSTVTKIWTLREAYEQNKTQQQCCVCGKPTETRSLCISNVQYCRCIESLKS